MFRIVTITLFLSVFNLYATTQGGADTSFVMPTVAQGVDPKFSYCNNSVTASVTSWAELMLSISSNLVCDSGTFAEGNCKIAGVPVDQSCQSHLDQVSPALRNIRGVNGVGCLNKVNSTLAQSLEYAMKQGAYKICCNRCLNDQNGETESLGTCAIQNSSSITLNTLSLSGSDKQSHCVGRYDGLGFEATLFHELLHTAGVNGFRAHPGSMFNHPETEVPMDERDVVSDPIYGCQNFCYGDSSVKNSTTCFACAIAEPVVDGKATETASWDYLLNRLINTWSLADEDSSQLPRQCLAMWNSSTNEQGRVIAKATTLATTIYNSFKEINSCVGHFRKKFNIDKKMIPFLDMCRSSFLSLHESCNQFVTTMKAGKARCLETPFVHSNAILQMCSNGRQQIQNNIIGSMVRFAVDRSLIKCDEWYPAEINCKGPMTTPTSKSKCL